MLQSVYTPCCCLQYHSFNNQWSILNIFFPVSSPLFSFALLYCPFLFCPSLSCSSRSSVTQYCPVLFYSPDLSWAVLSYPVLYLCLLLASLCLPSTVHMYKPAMLFCPLNPQCLSSDLSYSALIPSLAFVLSYHLCLILLCPYLMPLAVIPILSTPVFPIQLDPLSSRVPNSIRSCPHIPVFPIHLFPVYVQYSNVTHSDVS